MPPTTNQVNMPGQANLAQTLANALNSLTNSTLYAASAAPKLTAQQKILNVLMEIQEKNAEALAQAQTRVAIAYGLASGALLGYVHAGLSGTTTGEHLNFQFQELNRQIASLFLPAIEKGIQKLTDLVQWFRNLSGEQQHSIGRWLGVGTAMLGLLTIGPKLVSMFGLVKGAFTGAFASNPLLATLAAMGLLMAQSEGGRESLSKLGSAAMDAFGALADILSGAVIPIVEYFTELLSKPGGQLLVLGLVATLAAGRVVAACRAMAAAFMTVGGAITLGLGLIGLLVVALSGSGGAISKAMDDIAAGVRSGKKSVEDAKKEVRDLAKEEAFKEAEKNREGPGIGGAFEAISGPAGAMKAMQRQMFDEEQRRKQIEAQGLGKVERAAGKKEQRSDVVTARTGTESDPKQTIRRIEDAALKTDIQPKRTADAAEGIFELIKDFMTRSGGENKDNRENQPKKD